MKPEPIDRISATMEPDAQAVMRQDWRHILFLHWEVPPQELQELLPAGLSLDTFDGKAYVGLVPFTVSGVRVVGTPPLPWISSFHEINVRTYVHHNGSHPGVWFFSLDASSSIAVAAARAMYKLPYFNSQMTLNASDTPLPEIEFSSRREDPRGVMPAACRLHYRPVEGPVTPAAQATLDYFLIERYILYSVDEERNLYRARVHHQPYPLQHAEIEGLEETMVWAARVRRPQDVPIRHYAREVNVKVYLPEKVEDS